MPPLTPSIASKETPEELIGALTSSLNAEGCLPTISQDIAKALVTNQGYDTAEALSEMEQADLSAIVLRGQQKRVIRALFAGVDAPWVASTPPPASPPVGAPAEAPSVAVTHCGEASCIQRRDTSKAAFPR